MNNFKTKQFLTTATATFFPFFLFFDSVNFVIFTRQDMVFTNKNIFATPLMSNLINKVSFFFTNKLYEYLKKKSIHKMA